MRVGRIGAPVVAMVVAVAVLAVVGACGDDDDNESGPGAARKITVYSGRNEQLVGPLLEQFTRDTGIEVAVRYGDSAALAAQIADEGDRSPADVFFSQDAGALGAVAKRDLLARLPAALLDRVDARFRAPDGRWVGVSGRARVIVSNPTEVAEAEVPTSVFALTDPKWKGRIGIAPTNASFQSFVTAMRVQAGEQRTRDWLQAVKANDPKIYEGNGPIVRAVNDGQVDLGLVNHYYIYEVGRELGQDKVTAVNHFLRGDDPGALVNAAGVGVLAGAGARESADAFVDYLLSPAAQRYFAERTHEYPLIDGVPASPGLPPLETIEGPQIDLSDLATIEETLTLLRDTGLL